ncbi:MAG TPA: phospholipid carrier-dependent glycosyltransferase [Anaerolineae bacterium]|nr:phospholipid carrier-dependent glycosyltransferase [Anaerolineae bacterium]
MAEKRIRRRLILIIGLYLLLGAAYSLVVPLGEAPDEIDHILYVRHLVETRSFPIMQPVAADNVTMEANQPPLYYLVEAALSGFFPMTETADFPLNACYTFTPGEGRANFYLHKAAEQDFWSDAYLAFRIARLVSLLLGALTVWLAYKLGRQMAPRRPYAALLAAALLAFNPQFVFMTASVNNDNLMALLGAAIVYWSVTAVIHPARSRFLWLGLLMGLALLTKFALLALWPLTLLAAILPALAPRYLAIGNRLPASGEQPSPNAASPDTPRNTQYAIRPNLQSLISNLLLTLLIPFLVSGWWYWRANALYGDPLAWTVHLQAKGSEVLRTTPFAGADLLDFGRIHFQSYWGWFGWLKIQLPGWAYGLILLVVLTGVVGLVLEIRNWRLEIRRPFHLQPHQIAVIFNMLAVAAIYLSLLRYIQTINWSGYQGRLAYGVAASVAALLALGVVSVIGVRWPVIGDRWAVSGKRSLVVGAGLFLLAVGSLFFLIRPAYARPQLFQPAADLPRVCVDLPEVAVETAVFPTTIKLGETLPVTLSFYGLSAAESRPIRVQVVGRNGRIIAQTESVFSWEQGDVWTAQFDLPVAADAEPAQGRVQAGVGEEMRDVGAVKVAPVRPYHPQPQYLVTDANFGDKLALIGYDLNPDGTITLYWQALARMTQDYTTFIHLLDEAGNLVSQADSQPQNGAYPTAIWEAGEIVADPKSEPMAGQSGQLQIGVYLLETGQRLPLTSGGDVYTLPLP